MHQLWGWSFFSKCSKFNLDLKNAQNGPENSYCFLDNCILIACVKFPVLRREYLPSAVNVLTKCPKILHVTKGGFFQLNLLHSDQ